MWLLVHCTTNLLPSPVTAPCVLLPCLHRVVFEQLLMCWEQVTQRGMQLLREAAQQHEASQAGGNGRGAGRGKQKQKQLQLPIDDQGQPEWDTEKVCGLSSTYRVPPKVIKPDLSTWH